ncbi:MAG: hypothetical protein KDK60_02255 [Chlamydiia bacterium]|nr:hypothetical protein [Chlamydiia bacterium]
MTALVKFMAGIADKVYGTIDAPTMIGHPLNTIVAYATYQKPAQGNEINFKETPKTQVLNDNFRPYGAMLAATTLAFLVLKGTNVVIDTIVPYSIRTEARWCQRASIFIPLFHLYGIAIKGIRDFHGGTPPEALKSRTENSDSCNNF